jgi:hypothetical protein
VAVVIGTPAVFRTTPSSSVRTKIGIGFGKCLKAGSRGDARLVYWICRERGGEGQLSVRVTGVLDAVIVVEIVTVIMPP